jgi:hypothetical protein
MEIKRGRRRTYVWSSTCARTYERCSTTTQGRWIDGREFVGLGSRNRPTPDPHTSATVKKKLDLLGARPPHIIVLRRPLPQFKKISEPLPHSYAATPQHTLDRLALDLCFFYNNRLLGGPLKGSRCRLEGVNSRT